jgi:hypothetical protein
MMNVNYCQQRPWVQSDPENSLSVKNRPDPRQSLVLNNLATHAQHHKDWTHNDSTIGPSHDTIHQGLVRAKITQRGPRELRLSLILAHWTHSLSLVLHRLPCVLMPPGSG